MSFLRLGVKCAVIDTKGRVLLSKREDLRIWNLPGGRLDYGESVDQAVAREVLEETGIQVAITHPVGVYYWQHWERMNILFAAKPVGGRLLKETDESSANHYFPPDALPERYTGPEYVGDIRAESRPLPQIVTLPRRELLKVQWFLRWRWIRNLLRGRPEPRFPRFTVRAVAAIYNPEHQHVLTLPDQSLRVLPRIVCDGRAAPWRQLAAHVKHYYPPGSSSPDLTFHWVGLWQNLAHDTLEFVFAATLPELRPVRGAAWSQAQNAPLDAPDSEYLQRIPAGYARSPVWLIFHKPSIGVIISNDLT